MALPLRLEVVWARLSDKPMTTAELDGELRRICRIQPWDDPSGVREGLAMAGLLTWLPDGTPGGRIWSRVTELPKAASLDFAEAATARAEAIAREEAAEDARQRQPGGKYHPESNPAWRHDQQVIRAAVDERLKELGLLAAGGEHKNGTTSSVGQEA